MKKHPLPNDTNGINKDDDEMIKKEQMGVELTKSFEGNGSADNGVGNFGDSYLRRASVNNHNWYGVLSNLNIEANWFSDNTGLWYIHHEIDLKKYLKISFPDYSKSELFDHDKLADALEKISHRFSPDIVFYVSGADPFAGDSLGRLQLSKTGLRQRDEMVLRSFREENIPVAVSMAGGYAKNVEDIVDIHFSTVQTAIRFSRK